MFLCRKGSSSAWWKRCIILLWHSRCLPQTFRIYRHYQIKNMCVQFESYLTSNIRVVITSLKKIKTAKAQTSSFSESNIFVWEQRANFSAINYFKSCNFCSKGFLLPLCVLDGLCYFLVALPGPSISLFFKVTPIKKYTESSLDQKVAQAFGA